MKIVVEDNFGKGGLIDYRSLLIGEYANNTNREVIDIALQIIGNSVTLLYTPITISEQVVLNGLILTHGANYDYIITGNVLSFNLGVLPADGHVMVTYKY